MLNQAQREAIIEMFIQGTKVSEISRISGVKYQNVYGLLYHGATRELPVSVTKEIFKFGYPEKAINVDEGVNLVIVRAGNTIRMVEVRGEVVKEIYTHTKNNTQQVTDSGVDS